MEIFLTNKLAEYLRPNEVLSEQMFQEKWSAHLFILDRRKNILVTHKETLYSFFILDLDKKDLSQIHKRIFAELENQLSADEINSNDAMVYFNIYNSNIRFLNTDNDQKTLGWIKDLLQVNELFIQEYPTKKIVTAAFFAHNHMNDRPVGKRNYQSPKQMLNEKIKKEKII